MTTLVVAHENVGAILLIAHENVGAILLIAHENVGAIPRDCPLISSTWHQFTVGAYGIRPLTTKIKVSMKPTPPDANSGG
jgi:hypothetical protein